MENKMKYLMEKVTTKEGYEIKNVFSVEDDRVFDPLYYSEVSEEMFNFFNEKKDLYTMSYPKDIALSSSSVILREKNPITEIESSLYSLIVKSLADFTNGSTLLAVVDFIFCNTALQEKGYFITENNRDEKYLEIVSKNDDELLDIFSKYLQSYDIVSPYLEKYRGMMESYRKSQNALSIEDAQKCMDEVVEKYL
jgi:uncharacterized pyridoxamine 5'-phosphate oxidase family protein